MSYTKEQIEWAKNAFMGYADHVTYSPEECPTCGHTPNYDPNWGWPEDCDMSNDIKSLFGVDTDEPRDFVRTVVESLEGHDLVDMWIELTDTPIVMDEESSEYVLEEVSDIVESFEDGWYTIKHDEHVFKTKIRPTIVDGYYSREFVRGRYITDQTQDSYVILPN